MENEAAFSSIVVLLYWIPAFNKISVDTWRRGKCHPLPRDKTVYRNKPTDRVDGISRQGS